MLEVDDIIEVSQDLHLLYVEDDETSRNNSVMLLELFFNKITIGIDGNDGLEKFKNNDIDIVITDIYMPNKNGFDLINNIKKIDHNMPIMVLSAHNETKELMQAIDIGVDSYVFKPLDFEQFIVSLDKILEKYKIRQDSKAKTAPQKLNLENIITEDDSIVVYMKLEDFSTIEGFYNAKILREIQSKVKKFLEAQKTEYKFEKIFQLDNGEYAMVIDKSKLTIDMHKLLYNLKIFQNNLKDSIITLGDIKYQISLLPVF